MRKMKDLKIRVAFLALYFCSLPVFAYAINPGTLSGEAGEDRYVRSVPVAELNDAEDGIPPPAAVNPIVNSQQGISPLSARDPETSPVADSSAPHKQNTLSDGSVPNEVPPDVAGTPSAQEVGTLIDEVISRMADAGLGENLSQTFNYAAKGDYEGLVNFHKDNPEILNELTRSIQAFSAANFQSASVRKYSDDWLEGIKRVQQTLLDSAQGAGKSNEARLITAVTKLYKPIAERMAEITRSLEHASQVPGGSGAKEPLSRDLLKNFSSKAKEYILNSFNRAQTNLANGALSNPLEATAYAAETATVRTPTSALDQTAAREMTLTEMYVKSKEYRVVNSVYIGKDFIYAKKMLHPPAILHPYLKWLLYTRNLTPHMVEKYLATREVVGTIYKQAKAGRGNIRYRNKVYGAFLPFAETAAGNYELVKPASPE